MADIAFLLTRSATPCDPMMIVEQALTLSMPLDVNAGDSSPASELASFSFSDGRPGMIVCAFLPVPYPNAASMATGPRSPSVDELALATSHLVLMGFGIGETAIEKNMIMHLVAAAVARSTDAVAAMLEGDDALHRIKHFVEQAEQISECVVPAGE